MVFGRGSVARFTQLLFVVSSWISCTPRCRPIPASMSTDCSLRVHGGTHRHTDWQRPYRANFSLPRPWYVFRFAIFVLFVSNQIMIFSSHVAAVIHVLLPVCVCVCHCVRVAVVAAGADRLARPVPAVRLSRLSHGRTPRHTLHNGSQYQLCHDSPSAVRAVTAALDPSRCGAAVSAE